MPIRSEIVKMPAFLASALINGDKSGLSDEDEKVLAAAYEYVGEGEIVDVGTPYFSWGCDLPAYNVGGEMADYVVFYND